MKNYTQKELKEIAQSKAESMTFEEMRETINYLRSNFPETLKAGYKVLEDYIDSIENNTNETIAFNYKVEEEFEYNKTIKFKVKLDTVDYIVCLMYFWNSLIELIANKIADDNEELYTILIDLINFQTQVKAGDKLDLSKAYVSKIHNKDKILTYNRIIEVTKELVK